MKWKPGKKQLSIMACVVICALIIMLIYYVLFNGKALTKSINRLLSILTPIILGCVIGYILTPILNTIEHRWIYPLYNLKGIDLKKPQYFKRKKKVRKISVTITMAFFFLILYAMLMVLIPQLIRSIRDIIRNFPFYASNFQRFMDKYLNDNPSVRRVVDSLLQEYSTNLTKLFRDNFVPNLSTMISTISKSMMNIVQIFLYLIVGIVVAVYVLNSKEVFIGQGKKLCYAYLKKEFANEVIGAFRYAHHTFTGFIMGKIVDSLIVGIICFIVIKLLKVPYPIVLAFCVGLTNLIPFFGPYIGGGFGLILLIMINPIKALAFLITIVVLQQIDGNIIGPLILGNSTGLSSFWVIFAIMFFGGIWGPIGWLIGVPVFACIYALFSHITLKRLREKKLPRDTSTYIDTAYMDDEGIVTLEDADNTKYYVHNEASTWRRIFKFYKKAKKNIENVVPTPPSPLSISDDSEKDDEKD
ncbi:Predicted PurR-regulated permease PerM [Butyrivibrio sp. ob235]|uniref:AI-2E family transporter n=1 Tax=Butyrivibrio sp. ob235 TaxID=1761780 RepID=UPI0008B10665|nr:AI-2E family transporter [Butyrivibrio sp. ob235]SEK31808.1 Predicted PurR-regulated permease PerM [Butyrivibrio sp. ob235]